MKQTYFCPAKINLFLEVGEKRSDGYHDIDSIMQAVTLCDRVSVTLTEGDGKITLTCDDPRLPTDSGNIAYRAAVKRLAASGATLVFDATYADTEEEFRELHLLDR